MIRCIFLSVECSQYINVSNDRQISFYLAMYQSNIRLDFKKIMPGFDTDKRTFITVFYDCYQDAKILSVFPIFDLRKQNKSKAQ